VWCATGAAAQPGLNTHLAVVTPGKLATALLAAASLANFRRQGPPSDRQHDFREATSSHSVRLQSAWCGGGGSARCNVFHPSPVAQADLKHRN